MTIVNRSAALLEQVIPFCNPADLKRRKMGISVPNESGNREPRYFMRANRYVAALEGRQYLEVCLCQVKKDLDSQEKGKGQPIELSRWKRDLR